ncbi:MAG: hypothetical protein ACYDAR_02350 [Thermomicrobiales bacterium]
MDEKTRIAYYDAHRGESQELTEVTPTPANRKREALTVTIAVRFSASEADGISRMARTSGMTFSEIVRASVQRYVRPDTVIQANEPNITLNREVNAPATRSAAPRNLVVPRLGSQTLTSGMGFPAR